MLRAFRALLVLALLCLATGLSACGTRSADLFVVTRTGEGPGARLRMLVGDGGAVRCNGGPERRMGDDRLLDARELVRDLEDEAKRGGTLPPGPQSVLSYRVRTQDGTVAFSDTSPRATADLRRLASFTLVLAREFCGLAR